jgi:hypothetical protein
MKKGQFLPYEKSDLFQNCTVCRSLHALFVSNLNLTFISYSFLNVRRKVLKLKKKNDEKRAITPKWVMGFT